MNSDEIKKFIQDSLRFDSEVRAYSIYYNKACDGCKRKKHLGGPNCHKCRRLKFYGWEKRKDYYENISNR